MLGGFPYSSVSKDSTCNAGDPGSIPGSGRFAREGIGYPLQYSWASLVVQLVKNQPAMQETPGISPGEGKKRMATHSSILAWRIPWTEETGGLQFMGLQRVRNDLATNLISECNSPLSYKITYSQDLGSRKQASFCLRHIL